MVDERAACSDTSSRRDEGHDPVDVGEVVFALVQGVRAQSRDASSRRSGEVVDALTAPGVGIETLERVGHQRRRHVELVRHPPGVSVAMPGENHPLLAVDRRKRRAFLDQGQQQLFPLGEEDIASVRSFASAPRTLLLGWSHSWLTPRLWPRPCDGAGRAAVTGRHEPSAGCAAAGVAERDSDFRGAVVRLGG